MILAQYPIEVLDVYRKWLEISPEPWWLVGRATIYFRHKHVPLFTGLKVEEFNNMNSILVPMPSGYPQEKMDAGIICTPNCLYVLTRNVSCTPLQSWVIEYLKTHHNLEENELSRGKHINQNDILVKGRKVFGEIGFLRGNQKYYGCFINIELTETDQKEIVAGMEFDRNWNPDKIHSISGLKNMVEGFNENLFIEELEERLQGWSKIGEAQIWD